MIVASLKAGKYAPVINKYVCINGTVCRMIGSYGKQRKQVAWSLRCWAHAHFTARSSLSMCAAKKGWSESRLAKITDNSKLLLKLLWGWLITVIEVGSSLVYSFHGAYSYLCYAYSCSVGKLIVVVGFESYPLGFFLRDLSQASFDAREYL